MDNPNIPQPQEPGQIQDKYEELVNYAQSLEAQLNKRVDAPFSEAHYRDKYLMRIVEFKDTLLMVVDAAGLSKKCRAAWKSFISAYFDPVVLLSNNSEKKVSAFFGGDNRMEKQQTRFEIGLIGVRPSMTALDGRNPRLIYTEDLLRSTVNFVLSRTDGDKREGLMQHTHFSSEVEKHYENIPIEPKGEHDKKEVLW